MHIHKFKFLNNTVVFCHSTTISSAEPGRIKAYSNDLRWRIVYQRIGMQLTFREISTNLNIAESTAHRILAFQLTGGIEPIQTEHRYELRTLDEESELFVIGAELSNPIMFLREVCQQLWV